MSEPAKKQQKKPWLNSWAFKKAERTLPNGIAEAEELNETWREKPKWTSKEKPPVVFKNPSPEEVQIANLMAEKEQLAQQVSIETEMVAAQKRRIGELQASLTWTERELEKTLRRSERALNAANRKAAKLEKANGALRKNQPGLRKAARLVAQLSAIGSDLRKIKFHQ